MLIKILFSGLQKGAKYFYIIIYAAPAKVHEQNYCK